MSTAMIPILQGLSSTNISVDGSLIIPGNICQIVTVRSDTRTTFSSPASGNGTTITSLNLTISPKFSNSLLILTYMINGEFHQDNVFLMHQDGVLITTPGYQGYNNSAGNVRWSGIMSAFYDRDESSTPSNWFMQYAVPSGSTESRTYAPAVRSSSSGVYTFSLNRTLNGSTGDNHESQISTGSVMEVMQ